MAITQKTRTRIADAITARKIRWAGRMDEDAFLGRLYATTEMPSHDHRFRNAARDIWQHRVNNRDDWDDDWVFYDARFDIVHANDGDFLRFLAETVHPLVRPDVGEAEDLVELYNQLLRPDGYELAAVTEPISGQTLYAARAPLSVPPALREIEQSSVVADHDHLVRQITRMQACIDSDPGLAIGTAKELIESACKTILEHHDIEVAQGWRVARLMKETTAALQLTPAGIPDDAPAIASIRQLLGSLSAVVGAMAELRNAYGTGHGRGPSDVGLQPRHARLAVGAATTLAIFLFNTFDERTQSAGSS